jgi:hypothetical protein
MNIKFFKNIVVIAAFALIVPVFAVQAEDAPAVDNSNSTSVTVTTTPAADNSNSTGGTPATDNSNSTTDTTVVPGSDNSNSVSVGSGSVPASDNSNSVSTGGSTSGNTGGSTGGSTGGNTGGSTSAFSISPLYIVNLGNGNFWVAFTTSRSAEGALAYGTASQTAYNSALSHFGYQSGAGFDASSVAHGFTITLTPGSKYFIRPVARMGSSIYFGAEVAITPATKTGVIETPTTGETVQVAVNGNGSTTVATASSTNDANTASVSSAVTSSIVSFFKNLWLSLTSSMCVLPN